MSVLLDETKYRLVFSKSGYEFYVPLNMMEGYHVRRYVEIERQRIYAASGATPEVLQTAMDAILDICNSDGKGAHSYTDISAICNMVKYRLEYPIDQHCAVRVGALLVFVRWAEGGKQFEENPDDVQPFFTDKKVDLALMDSDVYAFFLITGTSSIREYSNQLEYLDENYYQKRAEAIRSLCRLH